MPEQTTTKISISAAIVSNLLNGVKPQLTELGGRQWDEIVEAVRIRATEYAERNAARAIDSPSQQWLRLCSLVLAVDEELRPLCRDPQQVLTILFNAMAAPFKAQLPAYLAERFKLSQDISPPEAFAQIAEHYKPGAEERYGKTFTFLQDVQDGTRSFTRLLSVSSTISSAPTGCQKSPLFFRGLDHLSWQTSFISRSTGFCSSGSRRWRKGLTPAGFSSAKYREAEGRA